MSTSVKIVEDHLKKLQALVDIEVHAVQQILSEQLLRTDEEKDTINNMLDTFLEQNSWAIGRLRGSLELSAMIKHGRKHPTARNQLGHPTKTILLGSTKRRK